MEKYSSRKLELLGLKWAVTDKFKDYGAQFIVRTDNNPLTHLKTAKLSTVEQRWVGELASFDFQIVYRPGRINRNANALSRQCDEDEKQDKTCFVSQVSITSNMSTSVTSHFLPSDLQYTVNKIASK